jgi:hypothetical protein
MNLCRQLALRYPLNDTDIACLLALRAGTALERDALVLGQTLESGRLDILEMGEQIGAAAIRSDKAETFGIIEPFHHAGLSSHVISFLKIEGNARNARGTKKYNRRDSNRNGSVNEQDGKETNNNYDLMQVQAAIYRGKPGSPTLIFIH